MARHICPLQIVLVATCVYYYTNTPTSKSLIKSCRDLFLQYGGPEEFSSDGGPQFKAEEFQTLLKQWECDHRCSSAHYPLSNGRAELAVKTSKRMIQDNIAADGSLNCQKFARAMLQYRNTPLTDCNLSPTQILFHRNLHDFLPCHPYQYKPSPWLHIAKCLFTLVTPC